MASADGIPVLDDILAERGARYGSFEDNAAIVQRLKRAMRGTDGWNRLSDAQREGLEMMVGKIGRMLSGDPTYLDNGTDLAGYAGWCSKPCSVPSAHVQTRRWCCAPWPNGVSKCA